jgi:hypothetical protein
VGQFWWPCRTRNARRAFALFATFVVLDFALRTAARTARRARAAGGHGDGSDPQAARDGYATGAGAAGVTISSGGRVGVSSRSRIPVRSCTTWRNT